MATDDILLALQHPTSSTLQMSVEASVQMRSTGPVRAVSWLFLFVHLPILKGGKKSWIVRDFREDMHYLQCLCLVLEYSG